MTVCMKKAKHKRTTHRQCKKKTKKHPSLYIFVAFMNALICLKKKKLYISKKTELKMFGKS